MNKLKTIKLILFCLIFGSGYAQNVGINNTDPQTALDINGALRIRPQTVVIADGIADVGGGLSNIVITGFASLPFVVKVDEPKDGQLLIINNTTTAQGSMADGGAIIPTGSLVALVYNNLIWKLVQSGGAGMGASNYWSLVGNNLDDPEMQFVGTTNSTALGFRTDNVQRMQIGKSGQIGIGDNYSENDMLAVTASKEPNAISAKLVLPFLPTYIESVAIRGINSSIHSGDQIGGYFESNGYNPMTIGDNIGIKAVAKNGSSINYALFATTETNNSYDLAGYFDKGHVRINNTLAIGKSPNTINQFEIRKLASKNAGFIDLPVIGKENSIYFGKNVGSNSDIIGLEINLPNTPTNRALEVTGNTKLFGSVGINTLVVPNNYLLAVNGKIIAEELRIQNSTLWPDYVFEKEYNLPKLEDIQRFIAKNKHLPNVPSAAEVAENGIIVGDMQKTLLRKIEELTLYILEQEKRLQALENLKK